MNYTLLKELMKQSETECGFDPNKFAELIVGECMDTVLDSSVEYTTRPQIAEELKEHFGLGLSTEDKKNLIKELLGVKNE